MGKGLWALAVMLLLGAAAAATTVQPAPSHAADDQEAEEQQRATPLPTAPEDGEFQPEAGKGNGKPATRTPTSTSTPSSTPTRTPTAPLPTNSATRTPTASPPAATATPNVTATIGPTPLPIWRPALNTSWQIQFTGTLDTSVPAHMFDVDLFDTPAATVAALKAAGKRVVCYISAGTWEDWRPDASSFPESVKGNSNGWPGERYLDIRRLDILGPIMQNRLDYCWSKGFDAVDFDNVDTYTHGGTGFALTYNDQLAYNRYLADHARVRGLSVGLKNNLSQIADLLPWFDWAINEQCYAYNECGLLQPFVNAGKAVFIIEYDTPASAFCPSANASNFNAMRKNLLLDAWREPCR